MEALVTKRLITRDEYYTMWESGIIGADEKVELVNGEIIQKMSPVGSRHASTLHLLADILRNQYQADYQIRTQDPVMVSDISEPEPDIAVLLFREDYYRKSHPSAQDVRFVIEISDSTLSYDQTTKKELYAVAGISIYWIVNLKEDQVEVYSGPVGALYKNLKVYGKGQKIPLPETKESILVDKLVS